MIKAIATIAQNTLRESLRDRILLVLLVFGALLIGTSVFLGSVSLDQDSKIIIDFGLFGIFFFGVVITIFLSSISTVKELEQRSAYTVLTRPIERSWYIMGKFFGLLATLAILTALMSALFLILIAFRIGVHAIDAPLLLSLLYIYLEFCVITALGLFFSSFSSAIMSTVYCLAIFLIGHSSTTIRQLTQSGSVPVQKLFNTVYYVLPNLEKFNLRNDAVYHIGPQAGEVGLVILYAITYCAVLLFLTQISFKKQEF